MGMAQRRRARLAASTAVAPAGLGRAGSTAAPAGAEPATCGAHRSPMAPNYRWDRGCSSLVAVAARSLMAGAGTRTVPGREPLRAWAARPAATVSAAPVAMVRLATCRPLGSARQGPSVRAAPVAAAGPVGPTVAVEAAAGTTAVAAVRAATRPMSDAVTLAAAAVEPVM